MKLSPGKLKCLQAISDSRGVIGAAAIDHRKPLQISLAKAKGVAQQEIGSAAISEFKAAVTRHLSPLVSAVLLDIEYGLEAARTRPPHCGLMLAYEISGYDNTRPGRYAELLPDASALRLQELGAHAIKLLLHFTPFEEPYINDCKKAFVERIGAECAAVDIPFLLELVGYDPAGGSEKGFQFAKLKPDVAAQSITEFSRDRYLVDILKVEIPINLAFAQGARCHTGTTVFTKQEALDWYRRTAAAARRPFIYLSAGVTDAQFTESLEWAAEAGVPFSGVLCGRATWQDGVTVYGKEGLAALEKWLASQGVANLQAINDCLKAATPWYRFYGAEAAAELAA